MPSGKPSRHTIKAPIKPINRNYLMAETLSFTLELPKELVDRYRETQRAYGKVLLELQEYVEKHHPEHRP